MHGFKVCNEAARLRNVLRPRITSPYPCYCGIHWARQPNCEKNPMMTLVLLTLPKIAYLKSPMIMFSILCLLISTCIFTI